jgi:signal transduction histidine kinase
MISSADAQLVIATRDLSQATEKLEWNVARIREAQHQSQRNLARALHGSVQAKLASAYLELEKVNQDNVDSSKRADEILAEIQRSIVEFDGRHSEHLDLPKLIAETQANWSSVATITCQISEQDLESIQLDALCEVALIDVIPELVFNAIKHGKAHTIVISIKFKNQRVVELTVDDNGVRELVDVGSGLGTKILEESAISWSRERVASHTITTAEFAYSLEKTLPH